MRTTRPEATCSAISDWGESITSPESSTPRLTGPGCISSWRGPRRRESIWKWAAYSRIDGHEALAHPLALQAQRVDDVGLPDSFERVLHRAAELLEATRDQRRRPADGQLGAHRPEGDQVGAGDATVQDVADDPDPLALERAEAAAQRVDVEQRLAGVLVLAVTGVDDRRVGPFGDHLAAPA